MIVDHPAQTELDERDRCSDLAIPTLEIQNRDGPANSAENEGSTIRFEGLIHVGQKVFLIGDHSVGKIERLVPGAGGQVAYIVVRTAHLLGRHKILAVSHIQDVNPKGVWLSIGPKEFHELPDDKSDASIASEVERALWNDEFLRATDYREVDVRVENGVVSLNGHITGMMNLTRIESAVGKVKGILGVRIHLVEDDRLLLKVAGTMAPIQRVIGNRVFVKVENGVVSLSGKVISANDRDLAEQYAAGVSQVRGVINQITAPGVDLAAEDQQFFQPSIGERIYFRDSLFGIVRQVIINRNNRRVVGMILEGRFPDKPQRSTATAAGEDPTPGRFAVVPVTAIRYLTGNSGYLLIDSIETSRYQDFDPESFITPNADWVPPYPYYADNVRFVALQ